MLSESMVKDSDMALFDPLLPPSVVPTKSRTGLLGL